MCDDHAGARLTRRDLLKTTGTLAVAAAVFGGRDWVLPAPAVAAAPIDGALSMAMHVHSSFSEGSGSMNAHLFQAQANGVDVIWWSDHDTRLDTFGLREVVHFTSLDAEEGDGKPAWIWEQTRAGSLTADSTGGIVDSPASPLDTVELGSMLVSAQGTGSGRASLGFYADSQAAGWNYRSTLAGQTLYLEVLPTAVSTRAYLELLITSSDHPAIAGRGPGSYRMSYRFGGTGAPGSRTATGLMGIVNVPIAVGEWNSVALDPAADFAALFSGLDVRDLSLYGLNITAISSGGLAQGYFDYLRFSRQSSGEMPLQVQADMEQSYAAIYPGVGQRQAIEVSKGDPHLNWFGGAISLPTYGEYTGRYDDFLADSMVPLIHDLGGLVSYNHPYGTGSGAALTQPKQDSMLNQTASSMVANFALGADILEVGYPLRAGVDLKHHLALWDICSRNAIFLTGNGVTDAHHGTAWNALRNDWMTSVWTGDTAEAALLMALKSGRSWCGSMTRFRGALDLLADGSCPMGSASISQQNTRQLTATALSVPPGGNLQIVQGRVDYAGPSKAKALTKVIASYPDNALSSGSVTLTVPTGLSSFVRSQVLDSTGLVVGLSNPVWLLRETPPTGIPPARAC